MATTTNFGWETPDDTDLVKDGALAIRTLGNSIDTSLVDLKGGTTGQVLSKTSNTDMDFTWVTSDDANAIQNAIVDAKGDLISATAADTPARLAVGSDGQVLTADSSTATGLKWAAAGGGAYTLLTSGSLTGSSVTSATLSGSYTDLKIVVTQYQGGTDDTYLAMRFNGDSGTNYQSGGNNFNYNTSPNATHIRTNVGVTNSGTSVSLGDIYIPSYSNSVTWKYATCWNVVKNTSGGAVGYGLYLGNWASTSAITSVTFFPNTGSFNNGSYSIYGVK